MSGNSINFEDKKITKSYFYKSKIIFKTDDIDVNKILVKKSLKYFVGYNDDDVIRPLFIKLPQMIGYAMLNTCIVTRQ